MSDHDPIQQKIDALKKAFAQASSEQRRLAALASRLELLKEWLYLSRQRLAALRDGAPLSVPAEADSAPPDELASPVDGAGEPAEAPAADASAAVSTTRWVRLLQNFELDGVELPAGVIVQVNIERAAELAQRGVAEPVDTRMFGETTTAEAAAPPTSGD